jgi:indolepyruvate ferredoxin oxidoreductase alpha subunit
MRPLNAMDTCVDMGASITIMLGMEKALEKAGKSIRQVAVIGDSTFFHSGITGLIDVIYNRGKSTVIILDNSITAMTGHQENPGSGRTLTGEPAPAIDIYKLVKDGLGLRHTYPVDGYDVDGIRTILKSELSREEPSVIIVRRPCVLLFRKIKWSPMTMAGEDCTECHLCLKLGCPAISAAEDGKARINAGMCTGCTICAQICPAKAIRFTDEKGTHIQQLTPQDIRDKGNR